MDVLGSLPDGSILVNRVSRTVRITINRPDRRNAVTSEMLDVIASTVNSLQATDDTVAIVLAGSQASFCSGYDLNDVVSATRHGGPDLAVSRACDALESSAIPTLACVDGWCIGVGLELALACHLRIASPESIFFLPASKLGVTYPDHGLKRLARTVGVAQAIRMTMLSERFGADDALRMNLVHRVSADSDLAVSSWIQMIESVDVSAAIAMKDNLLEPSGKPNGPRSSLA